MPRVTAKTIVSATKGLEPSSGLTPLSYLREKLGHDDNSLCVVSGPSFAADLAAGRPLSLVSASQSLTTANAVASLFSGSTVRVYTSTDALGVEVGGIFKNVIAIAAGISDALELGPSARAGIISRGLAEMVRLSVAMGAEAQTLTGLSGLGDLIMTATENQSRNRTVGLRLGKGESIQEIIDSLGAIAEGVATAPLILSLAKKLSVDTPITEQISSLVSGDLSARQVASNLMNRPRKNEF
jgi:glycerol-3-phosphate dehydrogenase (NAD(P)+)